MRDFGCEVSTDEAAEMFYAFDKDNSGHVSFDELLTALRYVLKDLLLSLKVQVFVVRHIYENCRGRFTLQLSSELDIIKMYITRVMTKKVISCLGDDNCKYILDRQCASVVVIW